MDWAGWGIFGFVATVVLTAVMVIAQSIGWTRMDIPLMLGTMFSTRAELARLLGILAHLATGQLFALLYTIAFWKLQRSGPFLGGMFGLVHGLATLTLIVPFLPAIHPRMASERSGPEMDTVLEPPGMLALNFGLSTPVVTLIAHILYGVTLGLLIAPG